MTLKRLFIEFTQPFLCLGILMMALVATQATAKPANAKPAIATVVAPVSCSACADNIPPVRSFNLLGHIDLDKQARIIDYPILSVSEGDLSAFELSIPYDRTTVEILGITSPIPEVGMAYDISNNAIQFRWTRRVPADIHQGDTLAFLKIYLKRKANQHIERYFSLDGCKAVWADGGTRINVDWQMALPAVTFSADLAKTDILSMALGAVSTNDEVTVNGKGANRKTDDPTIQPDSVKSHDAAKESAQKRETRLKQQGAEWNQFEILSVIPNPTKTWADITYSISGDCSVYLKLFSPLNQEVMTLVNSGRRTGLYRHNITVSDVAAGIYFLRLETCRDDVQELSDVMKVVVRE